MIAAGFGAHPQQPRHVEAREGADNARWLLVWHLSSLRLCRPLRLFFLATFLPPEAAAIKSRLDRSAVAGDERATVRNRGSYSRRNFERKFHISEAMSLVLPQRVLMPGAV
jgi:hypothetical protein